MNDRIVDAWNNIVDFEDVVAVGIDWLDEECKIGHLVSVEHPDSQTTIIRIPHDIEICDVCDKLFDPSRGCMCKGGNNANK